jgi:putative restriction endonuclease
MPARNYGHVVGVPVGATFPDRIALSKAGVHRATQAGITGGSDGTESIVLNAGYSDDVDRGDEVIYTGHGGRNPNTGRQESDQELEQRGRALGDAARRTQKTAHRS